MFSKRREPVVRKRKSFSRPPDSTETRKRNRTVLKSLLAGGVAVDAALGMLLLYIVFLHMPYFNLQQVDVNGNRRLSRVEVIEASELEGGMNLLTVSLSRVADRLRRHPWIRSASVGRRFPGRIIIEIEERTPRAVLAAGKLYYLDEQAEFFTRCLPGDSPDYPLFTGIKPEALEANGPEVRHMARLALNLLDLLEREGSGSDRSRVSEIRMDLDDGLTLITASGRRIKLGKKNLDLKVQRYGRLKKFLIRGGRWGNARTIDLDYEDRALVRSGGTHTQG